MSPNISYQGPDDQYRPAIGDGDNFDPSSAINPDLVGEYADLTHLNSLLDQLDATAALFLTDLEAELQTMSLAVTEATSDQKLREAISVEWPTSLGPSKSIVTYRYYTYLENRDSSAANYIRKRYEDAARDVSGSSAIDFVILVKLTKHEIDLIREFLSIHVGILDDSSERRVVELLQDWASTAIEYTGQFRILYATKDQDRQLPDSETGTLGPSDAINAQAVLKVTLNQVNTDLKNTIKVLKKNFEEFSDVFYHNLLGPSLSFRTNVTRNIYPVIPGQLGQEVINAANVLDGQFKLMLTDLARRVQFFSEKFNELVLLINSRDNYRSFIRQLAAKGQSVVPGSSGTIVSETDTSDEAQFFAQIQAAVQETVSSNQFTAPHANLSGVDDPGAHPQYLNSSGGQITGQVSLGSNASIDGSVPSVHAHQGPDVDGTQQISGQSLLPGTLTSNLVSSADKPVAPLNLRVDKLVKHADSTFGLSSVTFDITVAWDGDVGSRYEVQVSQLPNN